MVVLGIDPGLKGGLAIVSQASPVVAIKMPLKRGKVDFIAIQAFAVKHEVQKAYIEEPYIRPEQRGAKAIFVNYGRILVGLELANVPVVEVHPRTWQAYIRKSLKQILFGNVPRDTKKMVLLYCNGRKYPVPNNHDGISDAWGVADYGSAKEGVREK